MMRELDIQGNLGVCDSPETSINAFRSPQATASELARMFSSMYEQE